jgi:hypothetical protein
VGREESLVELYLTPFLYAAILVLSLVVMDLHAKEDIVTLETNHTQALQSSRSTKKYWTYDIQVGPLVLHSLNDIQKQ